MSESAPLFLVLVWSAGVFFGLPAAWSLFAAPVAGLIIFVGSKSAFGASCCYCSRVDVTGRAVGSCTQHSVWMHDSASVRRWNGCEIEHTFRDSSAFCGE